MTIFFQRELEQYLAKWFVLGEDGATAIEYALLAALIGTTIIGAQTALGQTVVNMYQNAVGVIVGAMGT